MTTDIASATLITGATLHTLNVSPQAQPEYLARLLRCASRDDSLLLIENGVYACLAADAMNTLRQAGLRLYALQADIIARGLASALSADLVCVDDAGFVQLCTTHHKVVSWFAD